MISFRESLAYNEAKQLSGQWHFHIRVTVVLLPPGSLTRSGALNDTAVLSNALLSSRYLSLESKLNKSSSERHNY